MWSHRHRLWQCSDLDFRIPRIGVPCVYIMKGRAPDNCRLWRKNNNLNKPRHIETTSMMVMDRSFWTLVPACLMMQHLIHSADKLIDVHSSCWSGYVLVLWRMICNSNAGAVHGDLSSRKKNSDILGPVVWFLVLACVLMHQPEQIINDVLHWGWNEFVPTFAWCKTARCSHKVL